jgi:hypothetical protein
VAVAVITSEAEQSRGPWHCSAFAGLLRSARKDRRLATGWIMAAMTVDNPKRTVGRNLFPRTGGAVALGAMLATLLAVSPTLADTLTPKAAIRVMTQAGYSGIGGVTHDLNFYYAAAIDPKRKRVRVTVDDETGKIVAVMPLRGSGAAPVPPRLNSDAALGPIAPQPSAPRVVPYYIPPKPAHPVGVIQYPFNSAGQVQPNWCRFRTTANAPGC